MPSGPQPPTCKLQKTKHPLLASLALTLVHTTTLTYILIIKNETNHFKVRAISPAPKNNSLKKKITPPPKMIRLINWEEPVTHFSSTRLIVQNA